MNDYYRGKYDILLLNLLSTMTVQEENQLISELERTKTSMIREDLDNIIDTFGDDYESIASSIREQVYYKAATGSDKKAIGYSYIVDELINQLSLPTNDQYKINLTNSVIIMMNNLKSQGLSSLLAEWLIYAAMWDQSPYNYIKFIMDIWRQSGENDDFTPENVISIDSLNNENVIDVFRRSRIEDMRDYVQELDPLIEWYGDHMDSKYFEELYIDIDDHIDFIYATYHDLVQNSDERLAYDIIEALIKQQSIDLFKLAYEYLSGY